MTSGVKIRPFVKRYKGGVEGDQTELRFKWGMSVGLLYESGVSGVNSGVFFI